MTGEREENVCVREYTLLYIAFLFERVSAPCFIELLNFIVKYILMFYVNDEPEGEFVYWNNKVAL